MPCYQRSGIGGLRGLWRTCLRDAALTWPLCGHLYLALFCLAIAPVAIAAANAQPHSHAAESVPSASATYTCPMHPQIRQPAAGRCPICGMALVATQGPGAAAASKAAPNAEGAGVPSAGGAEVSGGVAASVAISPSARRLAGINTQKVVAKPLSRKIQSIGTITFDESRLATISAYVPGRIERLYADYTGINVKKGDHLAVIYSPKLYAAQVEYLQAVRTYAKLKGALGGSQNQLIANTRTRLRELGMSQTQIDQVIKQGAAQSRLEVYAPIGGTVIEKPTAQGLYLKEGQTMFKIADLSTVWMVIDVYPEDATQIHYGQSVNARIRSLPGRVFSGRVAFISPIVDAVKRTVSIRVEIANPEGNLRPGDFAESEIVVPVTMMTESTGAHVGKIYDKSLAGKFICPMHPQVVSDQAGSCSICGMALTSSAHFGFASDSQQQQELMSLPRNAVLRLGRKSVVYVETSPGRFVLRQIVTGPTIGDEIVVTSGLELGEAVATDGVFLIDSQMQLNGNAALIDVTAKPN